MHAINSRDVLQTSLFKGIGKNGIAEIGIESITGTEDDNAFDEETSIGEKSIAFYEEVPEGFSITTINPRPVGRVYLSECDYDLMVELRYAYNTGIAGREWVEFKRTDSNSCRYIPADDDTVVCVERSKARENVMYRELLDHDLTPYHRINFIPSVDKREWVTDSLPELDGKGYEIFGHKKLIASTTRYCKPKLDVIISAKGERSFICSITADFAGIPASLAALIHAVRMESNYIRLNDGSSGVMPQAWTKVLKKIFSIIKWVPDDECITVSQRHLPLLDVVYTIADSKKADDEFNRQLKQLQHFNGIKVQPQPEHFNGTMRSYQKAGFDWFYFLQQFHFGGCLADDMGLGKTVQTLALLQNEKNRRLSVKTSIVIVPTSVLFNWDREARVFTPTLLIAIYYGRTRKRIFSALNMADVVLTTYGTVLRDIDVLKEMEYNYVILDESQMIKNPTSRIIKAVRQLKGQHKLGLSGTPIENSLAELWSLFSFLNPGMFGPLSSFRRNIVKPIEVDNDSSALAIVKKMIFPFILRRTKQQVAKELPPKTESVVYTEMLPKQKKFYDITREAYLGRIMDSINRYGVEHSGIQVIEGMLRLRQVCCHPALIEPDFIGNSGKFILFDEYLENILAGGHRVLVFSQFESVLKLLKKRLNEKHIPHGLLTGKTRNREKVVMNFRENPIPVFLISLKAGGVGLNLVEADYVIHMDPWWNPAAENQASDRAHRIGQTKEVFVYKFITVDSIEERVLRMQVMKKALSNSIIQTEKSFFKSLTKQEIISLFS
jgi:non-specific serine/threonine protein kinase